MCDDGTEGMGSSANARAVKEMAKMMKRVEIGLINCAFQDTEVHRLMMAFAPVCPIRSFYIRFAKITVRKPLQTGATIFAGV
jgi:hypothetical protein